MFVLPPDADEQARSSVLESPPLRPVALTPGTKLGDYEIVSQIGSGGMGVVYRARDLRLGRDVAIKVLPAHLSSEPERLKRFEQEARSAAALNHPNILAVYQLGSYQGALYLVTEFLQGETLREQLRQGALLQQRVMDYGEQIADGLNAAHERGIIHRDLKPENLFVTKDNRLKILDFGLAKLAQGESDSAETLPTLALQSHPGTIAGTVGYMSPEQVRGEELDTRTDLFSFGVVLYEMIIGKRPFDGDTSGVTFEAILNRQPVPPTKLNAKIAPGLENIITKALEKDREVRYQHASDIRADLKRLRRDTESGHTAPHIAPTPKKSRIVYWLAPVAVLLLLSSALLYKRSGHSSTPPKQIVERYLTANPPTNPVTSAVVSPDGKQLVYFDVANGLTLLEINSGEKRQFPGTAGALVHGWYPDGSHLLVTDIGATHELRKMSTLDGSVRKLLGTGEDVFGAISPDGARIVVYRLTGHTELSIMGADGDEPRRILSVAPSSIYSIAWSPNSRRIIYIRDATAEESTQGYVIESCDQDGGERVVAEKGNQLKPSGLAWLPDGRLLFAVAEPPPNEKSENLWFTDVDPNTGHARGNRTRITNGLGFTQEQFSSSSDGGHLTFLKSREQDVVRIAEILRPSGDLGTVQQLSQEAWRERPVGWSADGRSIFFVSKPQGKWELFKRDVDADNARALISLPDNFVDGYLTPDREFLLFTEKSAADSSNGPLTLMRAPISGGSAAVVLTGRIEYRCASRADICVLSQIANGKQSYAFLDPLHGRGPEIAMNQRISEEWGLSPDGKTIAVLAQNEKDRVELLEVGGKVLPPVKIKNARVLQSLTWGSDSQTLYVSGALETNTDFHILEVKLDGQFRELWRVPWGQGWPWIYSAAPDGRHLAYNFRSFEINVALLENF